jgi:hypothetical protein
MGAILWNRNVLELSIRFSRRHLLKAIYFHRHGGLEVLEFGELPTPQPGPGEVLVRLKAAALNRMDLWTREGWPGLKLEYPHIPGADGAGEIAALGEGVSHCKEGDRVLHGGRIIPERGSWIEISVTHRDILVVRIDQSSKLPATVFLRAMDPAYSTSGKILQQFFQTKTVPISKLTPSMWAVTPIADPPPPRAERGRTSTGDAYGGAILCENGSSPTITKCVITNCMVTGAVGGMGAQGCALGTAASISTMKFNG